MILFIVVISAYREPSPGWIDKSAMFGASGVSFHIAFSNTLLNKEIVMSRIFFLSTVYARRSIRYITRDNVKKRQ